MGSKLKSKEPALSVIVVAICGSTYLARCLKALNRQVGVSEFEIIVSYDEKLEDISAMRNTFSEIKMFSSKDMKTPEELASIGISNARGRVVALTEDHCIPDEHWCRRTLEAHNAQHAAVGGAVECDYSILLNWAFAFCDYYRYLNPVPEGVTHYLTVCNVSYKRRILYKISKYWTKYFHEMSVNGALLANGETLWLSPDLVVHQQRHIQFFSAVRERYSFGRLFGSRRAVEIPTQRRIFYGIFAPGIPFLLLGRMLTNVLFKRRCLKIFLQTLPLLIVFTLAWSWGEFLGNLFARPPREVYVAR